MSKADPIFLLISLFLTGLGTVWLAKEVRELFRACASRRWPTGEAEITSSAVREFRIVGGRRKFEPKIEFKYKFLEQEHVGRRIAFGDVDSGNRAEAEHLANRFGPGTLWKVSICERRPELSVLHPGPTGRLCYTAFFFLAYTGLAVGFLVKSLRPFLVSAN